MELRYVHGDLFEVAPKGAYLAHACNAQGVWGAGIAKAFKDKYPKDFKEYKEYCYTKTEGVVGSSVVTSNNIICLITSNFYDKKRLPLGDIILSNTVDSLWDLEAWLPKNAIVYSNKFNSGLFNVPWEHTEYLIKCFLQRRSDISWVVVEWTE